MTDYALSPAARVDLWEIWDYTARNWGEAQSNPEEGVGGMDLG